MTTLLKPPSPTTPAESAAISLDGVATGRAVTVVGVEGNDELSRRLVSIGLWPGARVERIAQAPFGDPLLFRLHGYRLALRRSEASRVLVVDTIA